MAHTAESIIARADAALENLDIVALLSAEADAKSARIMTRPLSKFLGAVAAEIANRKFK